MNLWKSFPTIWAGAGPGRKRGLRVLPKDQGYFVHVTSRAVGQAFLFGPEEKQHFMKLIRKWSEFSGMAVITHCLMDNHFHLLLWVPKRVSLEHPEIVKKLKGIWPKEKVDAWDYYYQAHGAQIQKSMDQAVLDRMADLPEFMRVLKQSFTRWYNRRHDRKGTLWDARYRSVVVEGTPLALLSVAAYIDLNPLRAGMVADPMDYTWSGYGMAMGGDLQSRQGLEALICLSRGHLPGRAQEVRRKQLAEQVSDWREIGPRLAEEQSRRAAPQNWNEVQAAYRIWLVHKGEAKPSRKRKGLDPVQVVAEYEKQGVVPMSAMLRCRMRTFTRGVAVGGAEFLEKMMGANRSCFGANRKHAGRPVTGTRGVLMSLRKVD